MIISYHAKMKYIQEMVKKGIEVTLDDAEIAIQKLFNEAIIESDSSGLVKRKIDNKFEDAIYYRAEIWRLVLCNDVIVTVEVDSFKFTGMGYIPKKSLNKRRKKRWSRYIIFTAGAILGMKLSRYLNSYLVKIV
jgi:hypothetical protein